jgi:membrane protease YdiL (CAAX protease family)
MVLAVAYVRASRAGPPRPPRVFAEVESFSLSAPGLFSVALVNATVLLLVSLIAARRAGNVRAALRLGPTRASTVGVVAAAAGLTGLSLASGTVGAALRLPGMETMNAIAGALAEPKPARFALAVVAIGLVPGVAEETFFRGCLQGRLVASLGRWPGIALAALAFGFIHLNVVQGVEAFVAGIYLGWVTERFEGVRPAIAAHAFNNVIFVVLAAAGAPEITSQAARIAVTSAGVGCCLAALALLRGGASLRP